MLYFYTWGVPCLAPACFVRSFLFYDLMIHQRPDPLNFVIISQVLNFGDKDFKDVNNPTKMKEKKLMETEELNFLLQSGIVLCKLAAIVVPDTGIETDDLQVNY